MQAPGFIGLMLYKVTKPGSVLSLSLDFFLNVSAVLLTSAPFCVVFYCVNLCVLSLGCSCSVISTSESD